MVLKNLDVRLAGDGGQERAFDLTARDVFGVQDPTFGMAAFLAQIQFPRAAPRARFAFGELHAQLNQLRDARRTFLHDGAHDFLPAQSGPRLQGIAHVHLERVLPAGDRRDAPLGVVGVGLCPILLGDDGHPPLRRDLQGKG